MAGQIVPDTLRGRVFVAGGETPLGAALQRRLRDVPAIELCGADAPASTLRDAERADALLACTRPTHVIVTAGRTGGIAANQQFPADLMVDNLRVATAVIPAAHRYGVESLLYVASSCTYPRAAAQPMHPSALFTGPVESTSEAYATAKAAGLVMCRAFRAQYGVRFIAGIAGDAYGPGEDFDPEQSHVVAGLIRRMHEATCRGDREFSVWGSGRQVRDLIFVDDLAEACVIALAAHDGESPINLSAGIGVSIADLVTVVRDVVGFDGELRFDTSKPDGAPLKVLDATAIRALGFAPRTTLRDGIERTYAWFLERSEQDRPVAGCVTR